MKIGIIFRDLSLQPSGLEHLLLRRGDLTLEQLEPRLSRLEKHERYGKRYNPPATKASGLVLGADLLYWQARENGIPYVIEVPNPLSHVSLPPFSRHKVKKSHVKELDFDWDFGVRVHGGLQLHRDAWQILGTWTHFDTKARDHGFTKDLRAPSAARKPTTPFGPIPAFSILKGCSSTLSPKPRLNGSSSLTKLT